MKKTVLYLHIISFIAIYTEISFATGITNNDEKVAVVVIDPGHGGRDLGASVGNIHEKDIVLDLSFRLGTKIKAAYPDVKIIYTRTNDSFIPVYERAEIANKNKADLFLSIHINAVEQTYVNGTETYVLGQHLTSENLEVAKKENSVILLENNYTTTYEGFDPNSPESYIMFELVQDEYLEQSILFASAIQDQFRETAKHTDRSIRQAGFLVLRQTTMPSVLIETGFISNNDERNYLSSEIGKNEIAQAIFIAFSQYKRKIEEKSQFAIIETDDNRTCKNQATNNQLVDDEDLLKQPENELIYSIQINASSRRLKPTAVNFKKEKNVYRIQYGNIYKYFTGVFKSYEAAVKEKERLTEKFADAFVLAFKNEELISVKMVSEN